LVRYREPLYDVNQYTADVAVLSSSKSIGTDNQQLWLEQERLVIWRFTKDGLQRVENCG